MQRRDVATVPSDLVAVAPGSQPLRNPKHERFVTLRATLRPKVEAPVRRPSFGGLFGGTVRKSGWRDQLAYSPIVTAVRVCLVSYNLAAAKRRAPSVTMSQPVDLERAGFALASDAAFHTIRAAVPGLLNLPRAGSARR